MPTLGIDFLRHDERWENGFGIKHFNELSNASGNNIKMVLARDMNDIVDRILE